MGSKTISLKDEAYERLKSLKTDEKSFSDVVMELTENQDNNFQNLIGTDIDTTAEEIIESRSEEDFTDEKRKELLR